MIVDDECRSDESSDPEEEAEELNPIILAISRKEDEYTEVAQHA